MGHFSTLTKIAAPQVKFECLYNKFFYMYGVKYISKVELLSGSIDIFSWYYFKNKTWM